MAARIPLLDCLWNDVLHFAPVHPARTQAALTAAGFPRKQRRYFEVDPVQMGFHAGNAVIFFHQRVDPDRFQLHPEDFAPFDPQALAGLGEIPAATRAYYREAQRQGRRPLVYLYVPHILYKGTLDIRGLNIVEVY
jgi:hypothetical protein